MFVGFFNFEFGVHLKPHGLYEIHEIHEIHYFIWPQE